MKKLILCFLSVLFLSFSQEKIAVLYRSLDPQSISQHLAFYHLFPESLEGKRALQDAWKLLSIQSNTSIPLQQLPEGAIDAIVTLITKGEGVETLVLDEEELDAISQLTSHLPNKKLQGYFAKSEEEVLKLPPNQVDLSHGLLLAQAEDNPELSPHNASYEALMDLMALQILTRVKLTDPPEKKIQAINRFIFEDMCYRFPPHSVYAKDIDLYTYLPSVIDSRRGVCLGVSILYLALSQRLDLPLEAVTPPGHIYVRFVNPEKTINIETTARGIHLDTEEYLGIETEELDLRSIKDVIGLAYYNEASVHWQNENYEKALKCYMKASKYLPEDLLLQQLMGFNYLFVGETEKGRALIQKVYENKKPGEQVSQVGVMEDFLLGKADGEAIRTIFLHVDEKRESLLKKKEALLETIKKWPHFRAAYFHLGVVWMQLNRQGEALKAFNAYRDLEKKDPTVEYLLCQLSAIRSNYPKAWEHLHRAEELLSNREKAPRTLKLLHRELALHVPE